MQICLKDTEDKDVIVMGGSPRYGPVSFTVSELTFTLSAEEARKLVKYLGQWVCTPEGPERSIHVSS